MTSDERIPQIEAEQFGFLLASAGVGMGACAAILGSKGQNIKRALLSLIGSLGVTASLIGLSFSTENLWLALLIGLRRRQVAPC